MESWKDIPGFEGAYQVSNLGRVRSLDRRDRLGRRFRGRVLILQKYPNGYLHVALGRGPQHLVHRLVAGAFLQNASRLREVNHKNGNRADNRLENLEWVSSSDNKKHGYRELPRKAHSRTTPVVLVKGGECISFPSRLSAAMYLRVAPASVGSALNRGHRCRGFEVRAAR